jgi:hypothetical protein
MIMRYTKQLAKDLGNITGTDPKGIERDLERLVAKHYPKAGPAEDAAKVEEDRGKSDEAEEESEE